MAFIPAKKTKKVMVVGGGPGGLNVAWVAAKRGHTVHVYEKRNVLGGQLVPGSMPGHKAELRTLIRFQIKQTELYGVKCHLNHEVTAKDVKALDPDVVVLATGSLPAIPTVQGIGKEIVLTYEDVLDRDTVPSKIISNKVVVVGGGPTGLELALYLTEQGCSVTVLEMLPKIGIGIEAITKKVILKKLKESNATLLTDTRLSKIEDNGVVVVDQENREKFIEAEKVVIAIGTKPDTKLYQKIKPLGYKIYQIGDCLEPRSAKDAIYDSAVLGRRI
jgi:pyruvate/2-oxoglutarate dehydrogenase complex dihydrolipoamide dehydrogenase (E3) component